MPSMSLRVGSLLRPLLGHLASCNLLFCSAGVTTPPAGHVLDTSTLCPFGGPQHLCAARRSTNNDRLYQQLHRGCQPLSTIAFAAFAALYLQQSLSPLLRPRLCPLSVPSAAAGSPIRQLVDYQPLHSTFNNRFRRLCGPLPMPIIFGRSNVSFGRGSSVSNLRRRCCCPRSSLAAAPSRSIGRDSVGNLRRRCCPRSRRDSSVNSSVPAGRVATPPAAGSGRYSFSSSSMLCGGHHSARWPQPQLWPGQLF